MKIQEVINVSGAAIISLNTTTDVKLKGGKKNPFQGRVKKHTIGNNVMIFQNKDSNGYENMVRNRLKQEGKDPDTFVLGERPWGTRIEGTPFIEHNEKMYIEVIFLKAGTSEYLVDGVVTDPDTIEGLERSPKESDEIDESQGGLTNKVIVRTYAVDSIDSMKVGDEVYVFTKEVR